MSGFRFVVDAISYRGNAWGHALVGVSCEFAAIGALALVLYAAVA